MELWIRFQQFHLIFLIKSVVMNKFLDWLDDRSIRGLVKEALYEKVPGGAGGVMFGVVV